MKLGVQAGAQTLAFFWEGCQIEEEDNLALGMIAKDGDMLTLVPQLLTAGAGLDSSQYAGLNFLLQAMPLGRALTMMDRPAVADDVTAAGATGAGAGRAQRATSNSRRQYTSGNDSADDHHGSKGRADAGEHLSSCVIA